MSIEHQVTSIIFLSFENYLFFLTNRTKVGMISNICDNYNIFLQGTDYELIFFFFYWTQYKKILPYVKNMT